MVERGHSFVSVHTFIAFSFLSDQRKMVHGLSITAPRTELDELERERREMTDKEREQSIADVYGTRKPVQETPELVADMLRDMQEALDKVEGDRQSHEYQTARWRLPDLVNSDDFHLMFLRSEFFDAKEAAKKMVTYYRYLPAQTQSEGRYGPLGHFCPSGNILFHFCPYLPSDCV